MRSYSDHSDDYKGGEDIVALLGPTNTGKTYRAIERMVHYDSGMIGFPLRLLARENYERLVAIKGQHKVALVTGEEKIIPRQAQYYCCTVEAMPEDKSFDFIAVDEVQLAEDPDRGHVFTDRILRARGRQATMFLGSDTMRIILARLVPGIQFETCERFSQLSYVGYKKLTKLPKRSAIVSFSMDDVYENAEMLRRQRGGTAVVLGALSPRTRNAQVEMYQSGEVDFLVATDAIGMGLNLDVRHVALAATRKFDGRAMRHLRPPELAQVAGRAGRYMKDGTFGVTGRVQALDEEIVDSIEHHKFKSVQALSWRNTALDFKSAGLLLRSLERSSGDKALIKGRPSDDYVTLKALLHNNEEVAARANSPDMVRLLWEVCQIPDFRQTLSDVHQGLIAQIYERVSRGPLDEGWVQAQITRLDDVKGDVDALMTRISHIRTWTFISFKSHWLQRAEYWQGKARAIEDKLSDALHEALLQRFVDRRAAVLMKSLEEGRTLLAGVRANGEVIVESHLIGHLQAFRFIPDKNAVGADYKAVMSAARSALKSEIKRRKIMILNAKPEQFQLDGEGQILWQEKHGSPLPGQVIARLRKGQDILKPEVEVEETDLLQGTDCKQLQMFLQDWVSAHISAVLEPLIKLQNTDDLSGTVRGIVFQVYENLGVVPRENLEEMVAQLSPDDRTALRGFRIKMGPILVFLWELTKPAAVRLRALLWGLYRDKTLPMPVPHDGSVSVKVDVKAIDRDFYQSIGYPVYGSRAIRIDMLDRVISAVYDRADKGKFQAGHDMCEWLGCSIEDLYGVLETMGHKKIFDPAEQKIETPQDEAREILQDVTAVPESKAAEDNDREGTVDGADTALSATPLEEAVDVSGEVSAEAASGTGESEAADTPTVQQPAKPELATFRLKKGKAFEKGRSGAAGKGSFEKDNAKRGDTKKKRGNPKGKEYKQSKMSAGPKVKLEDSPFAILQQLKTQSDDSSGT